MRVTSPLRAAGLYAAAVLTLAASSWAAAPRWVQATPFGGSILALAQAPSAPRILYAAAYDGRVYRSLDDGAAWHRRAARIGGHGQVFDLAVDPRDAQTVYARTSSYELFRSRDGGATWAQIGPESQAVAAVALDRHHPGTVLVLASPGLYRSDDGGDSWLLLATFESPYVLGMAIDPHATDTIFAVVNGASAEEAVTVRKSTNRGATWTSAELPEASGYRDGGSHFVFHPSRPDILYLFFDHESLSGAPVFRSTDGGGSWSQLPLQVTVNGLAVLPEGTLFIATDFGLGRSDDGGATWEPSQWPGFPSGPPYDTLTQILASSAEDGELIAAGSAGIWKSGDRGASWDTSNQGILAQSAAQVAVAPTGPHDVFAQAGVSLFRSTDQGGTWTRLQSKLEGLQPYVIEGFDLHQPRTLYGIAWDGQADFPVASTDGGSHWSEPDFPYRCGGDSICDVTVATMTVDRYGSIIVSGSYYFHFVGGGNFLLRSLDGGQTWDSQSPIEGIIDLVVDPRRRGTWHAVSCKGVFRSRDAGDTWQRVGRGLPTHLCPLHWKGAVLAVDPQDSQRLYLGTLKRGIFASSDGGTTFSSLSQGLPMEPVTTLLVDPTDSSKLYAGLAQKGVFRWNAERRRWTPLNQGLPIGDFGGSIDLDPRHPSILYAATAAGVFRLDLDDSAP